MRIALVIASLVLAAPAANACPPAPPSSQCGSATCWHGPVAVAYVAAGDEPQLVPMVDIAGFGGDEWPAHSVGVLVAGSSVRYVGPLAGMTSDVLRGTPSMGTLDDAVDVAIAELERIDLPRRVIYLVGDDVDIETFQSYQRAAARSGIDVYVLVQGDRVRVERGQSDYVTQVLKKPTPFTPDDPPRWPAVALLVAAAALSRRITG